MHATICVAMKIFRLGIGAVLVFAVVCTGYFSHGQVGFSFVRSGQKVSVSASTHPVLIVLAAATIFLFLLLRAREISAERAGYVGLARRFLAFALDLYAFTFLGGSILAIVPLWFEARRTGHFVWFFERDFSVPSDAYLFLPLALVSVLAMFLYFSYSGLANTQTVGSFVLGIKDFPSCRAGESAGLWRVSKRAFYAGLGLGLWPYTLWKRLDKNGRTWYDRASDWDVTRVTYK